MGLFSKPKDTKELELQYRKRSKPHLSSPTFALRWSTEPKSKWPNISYAHKSMENVSTL